MELTLLIKKRQIVASVICLILACLWMQPEFVAQIVGQEMYSKLVLASSTVSKIGRFLYPEDCFSVPFLDILHKEVTFWKIGFIPVLLALLQVYMAPYRVERALHIFCSLSLGYGVSQLLGGTFASALGVFLYYLFRALGLFKVNYYVLTLGILYTCAEDMPDRAFTLATITSYVMMSWTPVLMMYKLCEGLSSMKGFAKKVLEDEADSLHLNKFLCKLFYWIGNSLLAVFVLYLVGAHVYNDKDWVSCVANKDDKLSAYKHRNRINFWLVVGLVLLLTLSTSKELAKELVKEKAICKEYKKEDPSLWLDKSAQKWVVSFLFKQGMVLFCKCLSNAAV